MNNHTTEQQQYSALEMKLRQEGLPDFMTIARNAENTELTEGDIEIALEGAAEYVVELILSRQIDSLVVPVSGGLVLLARIKNKLNKYSADPVLN